MIRVLDSFIADKIAAGEVIERPVSIVKELIENSVDAGAKSIIVEIRNGGKSLIRVTDDGSGIPADEVSVAFLRHATSKISTIQDLSAINSLGFRGEALASIAAVSRLTIVTRTADEVAGFKLILHGGQEVSKETVGANKGTTIVVEDVFYNIPARRKFLGSDAREASAIIELIEHYAICYDSIKFMLINNGTTIFTTSGNCNKLNAITSVYPTKEYTQLIPIKSDLVSGYISDPGTTKNSRRGQLFFVNGRLVSSKIIERGIIKGYGDRAFSGYPIAILFIDVDPSTIDVNIHPGKKEIKFLNENHIIDGIATAISSVMNSSQSIPASIKPGRNDISEPLRSTKKVSYDFRNFTSQIKEITLNESVNEFLFDVNEKVTEPVLNNTQEIVEVTEEHIVKEPIVKPEDTVIVEAIKEQPKPTSVNNVVEQVQEEINKIETTADLLNKLEEITPTPDIKKYLSKLDRNTFASDDTFYSGQTVNNASNNIKKKVPIKEVKAFDFDSLSYKGYIFNAYIILEEGPDTIYILDQHAAHERVYYEQFRTNYSNSEHKTQDILVPIVINVSSDIYALDRDWLYSLNDMGYDIEDFGPDTFVIKGIPEYMELGEAEIFARTFIESSQDYSNNKAVIDKLIMKSCKAAVKANECLSEMEIHDLLQSLSKCKNPFSCPHGRPTFIKVSRSYIEKSFKRK